MSLIITNIDLHYLTKAENAAQVEITSNKGMIEVTDNITAFMQALHNTYNGKGSKSFGGFQQGPEIDNAQSFMRLLQIYLDDQDQFIPFSNQAVMRLKNELEKYDLAESGYLVTCHYELLGGRYLFVCLLPVSEHYYVDGELNISADTHIDTLKMQLAARIDLFEFEQNPHSNRYISFIKGRAGRKVSDFFLDFLGCEEGIDAKQQSQNLVQAVEDFVNVNQLNAEEKQDKRKELLSYCKEQKAQGKEVNLKEVSTAIDSDDNGESFYQFCQQNDYALEESFPHEQSVINKVTKYSGYGAGISVSFERSHFGNDVSYDPDSDTLTIHKVPPNLKDQLLKLVADQASKPANTVDQSADDDDSAPF
ncbi:nucleoid-associated protein YejK [Thalassotalea ponticola]|uniref:nucleoid-associated protein YejK n=1 Tax=Thalassotalea ponticola TaxID=1523392 RepID=UPI0025B2E66D|nr:nucleoid-associated protein YejK [Thalassotalea ponticola]MDN3651504.1 nucleoid-associated protein YejK [Thalassotalea ponticola]